MAVDEATRAIDPIMPITFVEASISANRELITSVFHMVSTIVEVLAKRGRIEEIEIIIAQQ
jgi:hypothetical protein